MTGAAMTFVIGGGTEITDHEYPYFRGQGSARFAVGDPGTKFMKRDPFATTDFIDRVPHFALQTKASAMTPNGNVAADRVVLGLGHASHVSSQMPENIGFLCPIRRPSVQCAAIDSDLQVPLPCTVGTRRQSRPRIDAIAHRLVVSRGCQSASVPGIVTLHARA